MSLSESLKKRREKVEDEDLAAIVDEALENQNTLTREVNEPTLKHGTDTVNYEDVISEGLVPGADNSSNTGESSDGNEVAFTTSYPVALRYAELTEAADYATEGLGGSQIPDNYGSMQSPMIVEIPVDAIDQASIDSRNESAINSVLGTELNGLQASAILEYVNDDNAEEFPLSFDKSGIVERAISGDQEAIEVFTSMVGEDYGNTEALRQNTVFEEISYNEIEGEFLQEVNTPYAPVDEEAVIYVPNSEVEVYRDKASEIGFEGEIHSIEARAIVHEERMKNEYRQNGTLNFAHPADEGTAVNLAETNGTESYNESSDVIDISRLQGEAVYNNGSRI